MSGETKTSVQLDLLSHGSPGHHAHYNDLESQYPESSHSAVVTGNAQQQPIAATPIRSVAHLDGVRGLAAFMVYMAHWASYWYPGFDHVDHDIQAGWGYHDANRLFANLPFVRIFFTGGNPAVAIFFVLSGYVLSRSPLRMMLNDIPRTSIHKTLLDATVRRPIRLFYPTMVVGFLVVLLMHLPFGLAFWFSWPTPEETLLAELVRFVKETSIALWPFVDSGPFGRWYCYNPPSWTIAVEFKGSIVIFGFLGVFYYVRPRWRATVILLTALMFLAVYEWALSMFMTGLFLVYNDLTQYDRRLLDYLSPKAEYYFHHLLFILGWWLLSQPTGMKNPELALQSPGWRMITTLTPPNYMASEYWRFWEIPGATLFVYGVLRIPWLQRIFSSRPLRYLGRISFSFYLVHMPFLWTFGDRIARLAGKVRGDNEMWYDNKFAIPDVGPLGLSLGFVLTQALILPINFALAEVGTRWLDEPSVRMGRWAVGKIPALRRE